MRSIPSEERGQASPEYVGAVLLLALLLTGLLALTGLARPASRLASTIAESIVCAVRLGGGCGLEREGLAAAYGPEVGTLVRRHAPEVRFEDGEYVSLPVDPRSCRDRSCADSSARGRLDRSWEGMPPTAFVRVIDCRPDGERPEEVECAGERAGRLYLQYWLYYPDSATRAFGRLGYHRDDWESFQVRITGEGIEARASSHHGYNHGPDPGTDLGEIGIGPAKIDARRSAWAASNGYLWVSEGSHAGRAAAGDRYFRSVAAADLRLIPLESELGSLEDLDFEVAPPWQKPVWTDPEHVGT